MTAKDPRQVPSLGFLTVCEVADQGWYGGYLIVNVNGRPLEFHCTAPIKPNRAQEILYGATLRPYLFGEQIGQTLVRKGRLLPMFLCTDAEPMLAVRDFIDPPVLLVVGDDGPKPSSAVTKFKLGDFAAGVSTSWAVDRDAIQRCWDSLTTNLDLVEPFSRIRGALDEARKSAA